MSEPVRIAFFFFSLFPVINVLHGQEAFIDNSTKKLFDSLDNRIQEIRDQLPRLTTSRDANYFYLRRELDMTIFLSVYNRYLFDEELDEARSLIESRLNAAEKRRDADAAEFYNEYKSRYTLELKKQRERYQKLFEKEKNFKKEFDLYLKEVDGYSLQRAKRMTELAIKYAQEQNLETVSNYLLKYKRQVEAAMFNFYSSFDVARLTRNESAFQSVFTPMVESDSIETILKAGELVEQCLNYAASSGSLLDTNYFSKQRKVVTTSVADYYSRKGNDMLLANMQGKVVVARFDTLNIEGVYKWKDYIVVIGHFQPEGTFENVKKAEAFLDADQKLLEYIRVNRLGKINNKLEMGSTFLIPFYEDFKTLSFRYNSSKKSFQYMVCITQVLSNQFTHEVSKFLPPIQFSTSGDIQQL